MLFLGISLQPGCIPEFGAENKSAIFQDLLLFFFFAILRVRGRCQTRTKRSKPRYAPKTPVETLSDISTLRIFWGFFFFSEFTSKGLDNLEIRNNPENGLLALVLQGIWGSPSQNALKNKNNLLRLKVTSKDSQGIQEGHMSFARGGEGGWHPGGAEFQKIRAPIKIKSALPPPPKPKIPPP